ncbi:MAG: hypothetical protein ACTS4T_01210 [Candidatus Hodgkinia cicadicola]
MKDWLFGTGLESEVQWNKVREVDNVQAWKIFEGNVIRSNRDAAVAAN